MHGNYEKAMPTDHRRQAEHLQLRIYGCFNSCIKNRK